MHQNPLVVNGGKMPVLVPVKTMKKRTTKRTTTTTTTTPPTTTTRFHPGHCEGKKCVK